MTQSNKTNIVESYLRELDITFPDAIQSFFVHTEFKSDADMKEKMVLILR